MYTRGGGRFCVEVQVAQLQQNKIQSRWSLASRIAFRYCFIYFGLYCLATQVITGLLPFPNLDIPDPASFWPASQIVLWTEAHILRIAHPIPWAETGSGDKTFDWALVVCLLILSALATALWSILDRRREGNDRLYKWFRLVIRFALAGQMIGYAFAKIIPTQMPFPYLTTLLEPFHNFSPMGVLWSSIGASQAYEIFAGCAELLGGVLLIFPRTTMLGALVCLVDMTQVFMLNMTYDVPVKLLSFHLILISLFLLGPEFRRLADFFFGNRTVEPSRQPQLFRTRRANRIALAAQIVFGIWLVGMNVWSSAASWNKYGGGSPKSALYGIWDVEELSIDGQVRSPLITDYGRWRRVVFDYPTAMTVQRMDDSFAWYGCAIDANARTIALNRGGDKKWKGDFSFQRPADNQLMLDGTMDSHEVHMRLQLVDRSKFMLVSRGFHWVSEFPFNR
jgi:hypothetical protein